MSWEPRYHINLFWYPDEACWIADVPDLRPCSAKGDTPERAVAQLRPVIDRWVETAKATDEPIPEPRYCPAIYATH